MWFITYTLIINVLKMFLFYFLIDICDFAYLQEKALRKHLDDMSEKFVFNPLFLLKNFWGNGYSGMSFILENGFRAVFRLFLGCLPRISY